MFATTVRTDVVAQHHLAVPAPGPEGSSPSVERFARVVVERLVGDGPAADAAGEPSGPAHEDDAAATSATPVPDA
jgi:hypothetical protein